MKILSCLTILLACLVLAACATTTPPVQFSQQAHFSSYHSFYWRPVTHKPPASNPILDSQILDHHVRDAVIHVLTKKGYQQVDKPAQADFIVTYQTATEQHLYSTQGLRFGFGIGSPFYMGPHWYPFFGAMYYPVPSYDIRSYEEGYLIVDIIDAHTKDLVWRSWETAAVSPRNFSTHAVNQMITTILNGFPPS